MKFCQLAVLVGVFACAVGECPVNWYNHGNSCYYNSPDKDDWYKARTVCETLGGHLADINDVNEGSFLASIVSGLNGPAFWLSNDMETLFDNNVKGKDCVSISNHGMRFDDLCVDPRNYICEKPATWGTIVG